MESEVPTEFWIWVILGALIGVAIGLRKGRVGAGFFFGLLLGPIGWLLVAVGPDRTLRRLCPACRGKVPSDASKCMHCGSDLGTSTLIAISPEENKNSGCAVVILAALLLGGIFTYISNSVTHQAPSSSMQSSWKDQFSITDLGWKRGEFGNLFVIGKLTNRTDSSFSYIQIEINCLDETGAIVGSTLANLNNLEPHETWKFEAIITDERTKRFRIKGVTAF